MVANDGGPVNDVVCIIFFQGEEIRTIGTPGLLESDVRKEGGPDLTIENWFLYL